jgi:hypothetical protein
MNYIQRNELREKCPAAFSTIPSEKMSDKYTMLSTINILDKFEEFGYFPTASKNSMNRATKSKDPFGYHSIRFRHKDFLNLRLNEYAPELVYFNSHNGRIIAKIMAGIFKMICSNGLVIASSSFGFASHKHMGIESEDLESVIFDFAKNTDNIMSNVEKYRQVELNESERFDFAKNAKNNIYGVNSKMDYKSLLKPRRDEDNQNDLFTVFNVVQENVIKGGIEFSGAKRKVRTKGINSVQKDLDVNAFLWGSMEEIYSQR